MKYGARISEQCDKKGVAQLPKGFEKLFLCTVSLQQKAVVKDVIIRGTPLDSL